MINAKFRLIAGRRGQPMRGLIAFIALAGLVGAGLPEQLNDELVELRKADERLAAVMYRLSAGNEPLCDQKMPGTGMLIQTLNQYPRSAREAAKEVFGFTEPVSVELVVKGSPADLAGILPNDGLASIASIDLSLSGSASEGTSTDRDRIERDLASLSLNQPLHLGIRRGSGSEVISITLSPKTICKTRFEVLPGSGLLGQSDGDTIQIGDKFIANFDDDALAVIAAHELAHSILHHRQRLEAAGVSKGLFSEFGKSLRLNRLAEQEADRLSVYLLANAGYDPEIAPKFWEGRGKRVDPGIFRSRIYASPSKRAAAMRQEIVAMSNLQPPYTMSPIFVGRKTNFSTNFSPPNPMGTAHRTNKYLHNFL